ncbi:acyltransferase family protein [Paraburkholderia rhizosphaerae]|uniref:Peptidoglycan/LPS O-acetylase OafA/YrhL n=1 Tax=Paraburkholderia rhizosphaerae TaxID=480658 RepID=A0A4R8LK57_9BURK|nr:acyltransferase [Paraburkholderia rhizosphaerae]TDY42901.1 peptidoglycan/LPS O-acetylase OafA/YrhL [Paraburkholderia rhizosphaerae]
MRKLNSIRILRAVAATTVIVHHVMITNGTAFGAFRVDIFFVLSGFVIALALSASTITVREFVASRVARVVPLYWLMTFVVFCGALVRPDLFNSTTANVVELLKSLFFIPYTKESGQVYPMLFVGWTLNYEILFYVVTAAALLLMRERRFVFIALTLGTLYFVAMIAHSSDAFGRFFAEDRVLEFPLGFVTWYVWKRGVRVPAKLALPGALAMYALMTCAEWALPGSPPLVRNGLPSFTLLMCALSLEESIRDNRATRALMYIGDASYATYLSHPFVVESMRKLLPKVLHGFNIRAPLGAVVAVICATCIGCLFYRYVDRPLFRFVRRTLDTRPRAPLPSGTNPLAAERTE